MSSQDEITSLTEDSGSNAADENKLKLTLGGQVIVQSEKTITNTWQACTNQNYLYVDSRRSNNTDKTQMYLNPKNSRLLIGQARLEDYGWTPSTDTTSSGTEETGDNGGDDQTTTTDQSSSLPWYNVYVRTYIEPIDPEADTEPTQRTSIDVQGKELGGGYGIVLKETSQIDETNNQRIDIIDIGIDKEIVATKQDIRRLKTEGSGILSVLQENELKDILRFLTVEHSDEIQNSVGNTATSTTNKKAFATSFQFKEDSYADVKFNCIRFSNALREDADDSEIYCVLRRCYDTVSQAEFLTYPVYVNNEDNPLGGMDKFEYLLTNSYVVAVSKNAIHQVGSDYTTMMQWHFPQYFTIDTTAVYLMTFQTNNDTVLGNDNVGTVAMYGSGGGFDKSRFNRMYNRTYTDAETQYEACFQFCYKELLGLKFKK